ncbi:MAG: CHAD domain-containing protein, partial [Phenylobacterium sp.]
CEAELELLSGAPADLFGLALDLAEDLPLTLSLRSKSDRGHALAGDAAPASTLPAGLSSGEALRRALLAALSGTCARVLAGAAAPSPEAVHGLRVALRRMRSLLSVFRRRFEGTETIEVRRGLQVLSRACGAARELDVLAAAADPAGALFSELSAARRDAAEDLARRLGSAPVRKLLLECLILVEAGAWRGAPGNVAPAGALAHDLARRWRRIRRLGERFEALDPGERHDLRLRVKAVRYALDGLDLPGWTALRADLLPALRAAQDALGAQQDGEAARARLAALDLSRTARREAARLVATLRRKGGRARAGRAVRRLVGTPAAPFT